MLSEKSSKIIIVEPAEALAQDMGARSSGFLLDRITQDSKIEVRIGSTVEKIEDRSVVVHKGGQHETISNIDLIVLASGATPNNHLAEELMARNSVGELHMIGDCVIPRKALEAISEGYNVALYI
jgi:2,4-dienoyl-CoA reductase (NADPH2)